MKLILLAALISTSVLANTNTLTFTNKEGQVILNAKVIKVDTNSIIYKTAGEFGVAQMAELPAPLRHEFGQLRRSGKTPEQRIFQPCRPNQQGELEGPEILAAWMGNSEGLGSLYLSRSLGKDKTNQPFCTLLIATDSKTQRFKAKQSLPLLLTVDGVKMDLEYLTNYESKVSTLSAGDARYEESDIYRVTPEQYPILLNADLIKLQLTSDTGPMDFVLDGPSPLLFSQPIPASFNASAALRSLLARCEVLRAMIKPTEMNSTYWRWAYQITIHNKTSDMLSEDLEVLFLDRAGFVLASKSEYNISLLPHETKTILGSRLVDTSVAPKVASIMTQWK